MGASFVIASGLATLEVCANSKQESPAALPNSY